MLRRSLSNRFYPILLNHSCSAIALTAYYLTHLLPPPLSVSAYNLAISGCGHMCLVESIQSYYLSPHAKTLHIVFIDVCINDNLSPPDELEMTYIEVVSFVRRKGGEVVFVCAWSDKIDVKTDSPKINFDLAAQKDWVVTPSKYPRKHKSSYNRCAVIGLRLSSLYHFPVISYQDSLLSSDGSFSSGSETAFHDVTPSLIVSPDNSHPSMFGSDLIAQTLSRWIYWRICRVLSLSVPLPPPEIPLINSTTSSLVELIDSEEKFRSLVTIRHGFEWKIEANNKAGWISEKFGSFLELKLPVGVPAGFLSIGYLQTYSSIGLFNLTVINSNHLVSNRRVTCAISKRFSQTAFITIPFNVSKFDNIFLIRIEHVDHNDVNKLKVFPDMRKFLFDLERSHFGNTTLTKVKIVSIGIYDSEDGLASRPREVDYNVD